MEFEIIDIQRFIYEARDPGEKTTESANIAIRDHEGREFMIQLGTDGEFSIPRSINACWNSDEHQDYAHEHYDEDEIATLVNAREEVRKGERFN